jgi:hypothetical protein
VVQPERTGLTVPSTGAPHVGSTFVLVQIPPKAQALVMTQGSTKRSLAARPMPKHGVPALGVAAQATGALALGALAVGAVALGALAIGRVVVGRARIRRLEIDELVVRKLRVTDDMSVPQQSTIPLARRRELPLRDPNAHNVVVSGPDAP